jgi:uncharacterized membrane protein
MASSKSRSRNGARSGAAARSGARTAPRAPLVEATPTTAAKPVRQAAPARVMAERKAETAEPVAAPVTAKPERPSGPPLWLQLTSFVLAILGLGVSGYETYAHFNGSHLAGCPTGGGGTFNCTAVITSPQSMIFGAIPVAVLGLLFYVFVVAIMSPWAWRWQRREVGWLRLVSMVTGMGFVMYLIYAELYQIGDICEYCTGVHAITFVLFCLTLVATAVWGVGKPKTE